MKKIHSTIKALSALLMAGATLAACSSDDIIEQTVLPVTPAQQTYTMTVKAAKGNSAATRALSLEENALSASWATNEHVYVKKENDWASGSLQPQASGTSATLTGELSGISIAADDELTLQYPKKGTISYSGQVGTLEDIAANFDYATADVTVASVSSAGSITTTADANFANQQAIVNFNLKDKATGNDIQATSLTIEAASDKLVLSKGLRGSGDKTYHTGYTATSGTAGFSDEEGYASLVDGNNNTKWCSNEEKKADGAWYVEFQTASAVQVFGYMLRTAADAETYPGRNPTDWVLKGKRSSADDWTVIDTKTANTSLPATNDTEVDFDADNPGTYQYFRFEISGNKSGDIMQLTEMKLFTYVNITNESVYGQLTVSTGGTSSMTVALRNENEGADIYTLTAFVGCNTYTYTTSEAKTFTNGKYYDVTVNMTKSNTVDLSRATGNYTVQDGEILTGTLAGNYKISIADGAKVTLNNLTINGVKNEHYTWAGLTCDGDATITLEGTNKVKGFYDEYPGIFIPKDKTIIIDGTGSLDVSSNGYGAGIGGGYASSVQLCGNIEIRGGTITAFCNSHCAAIGGGTSTCGNITISGGNVTATCNLFGAGIGSGYYTGYGGCGSITISGGTVNATGGSDAAGIGGGRESKCGTITITSGVTTVTATRGSSTQNATTPNSIGVGGKVSLAVSCGKVTIGGTEYWDGSAYVNGGDTYLNTSPLTYTPGN